MKKDNTIKSLLGLSQDEMSMLLGISRAQWAMFTSGKRDIPSSATKQLAEILLAKQKNKETAPFITSLMEMEQQNANQWLQREYQNVVFKQLYLERKIKTIKNIRKDCFTALEVAYLLEIQNKTAFQLDLAEIIKKRALRILEKHSLKHLEQLELKKESLGVLRFGLEQKINFQNSDTL